MADRESVIRDLRYVKTFGRVTNTPHLTEIAESALELLREQEQIITSLKADLQEMLSGARIASIGNETRRLKTLDIAICRARSEAKNGSVLTGN